ncbi:MAG: imidazole glycerol phosphate synthase subunit HisH [Oscillospiraceae bacterium]|jgi:glutamine amidotransferase|nr:imidazole glycerol phosphate synthase subunit HisH [Oscillospiraceae bacterium]
MKTEHSIAVIDYKAGNAPSVMHAAERLGFAAAYARDPGDIARATHIILPGVGSARATMDSLRDMGLAAPLEDAVLRRGALFMGICVGLQILFEHSEEEDTVCLGWLKGKVARFDGTKVRVPQMGWNLVRFTGDNPIAPPDGHFYFVNSYRAKPEDTADIWGQADYGGLFTAAVRRGNIYATQFHIEKSGSAGLGLLSGFLNLTGKGHGNAD